MGKIMLNGVDYSTPTQSGVSGVKGNSESSYRTGQVNLTSANIGALATNGDSKDVTTSFSSSDVATANATAWTDTAVLASGEKHSSVFAKLSQMFKNIRYLYNNKIDLSKILTTVEQCTASTNNQNIASAAVIKELNSSLSWRLYCKRYNSSINNSTITGTVGNQLYLIFGTSGLSDEAIFLSVLLKQSSVNSIGYIRNFGGVFYTNITYSDNSLAIKFTNANKYILLTICSMHDFTVS